ncbi:MAG TPA: FtsQ-type POTRA domain-containing protein [Stellaceae bacterium]|jgi:cell division protein FtsQ|nr:FtsQ-type POTRA domain-containing protein [Stellaceae bacterium]
MRGVNPAARRLRRRWAARLRGALLWIGVPVVLAAGAIAAVLATHSAAGDSVLHDARHRLLEASAELGLRVADIRVEGRATTDRDTILAALGARPGTPILAVDPGRAKQQLEALPWVRSALIERRLPDTIYVRLVEREPLALWQHGGKIELIDRSGAVIPVSRLDRFAKLPMVVGEDAARHAADLLAMLASQPDLAARVTAAVDVGGRRWNLRIDNTIDVLLPSDDPAAAWADLARLQRNSAILQRDVQAIDMRLPDRLVVRVAPEPAKEAPPAKKGRPTAKNT